jgi:GDPmannose 4,6-dehydratase
MSRVALITGVAGQDGSYLAEQLLARDYSVVGAVRDLTRAKAALPATIQGRVKLVIWDPLCTENIIKLIESSRPNEIYNCAAYSSGERMHEDPISMAEVNGVAVVRILDAIRAVNSAIRCCQASSSEMFGLAQESPQNERTPFNPRSPYGAAKVFAHHMVEIYRREGLFACSAILFNHESPRRRPEFVTRKITRTAAQIKLGMADRLLLGNLDSRRDWSFAGDFVKAMHLMLQAPEPGDYVLASGVTRSVREFCEIAFDYLGLDYRKYVIQDPERFRPAEPVQLVGDPSRAERELGWRREVDLQSLVRMMVDADLRSLTSQKEVRTAQ